jgi:hypothetical protein
MISLLLESRVNALLSQLSSHCQLRNHFAKINENLGNAFAMALQRASVRVLGDHAVDGSLIIYGK